MKTNLHQLTLVIILFTFITSIQAQFDFEYRTFKINSSRFAMEARDKSSNPPKTTNEITSIIIGIKWDNNANADLSSTITQFGYKIEKSDVEKVKNGFEYQSFTQSTTTLFPNDWTTNQWETIFEIDVTIGNTGGAPWDFEVCEDGFDITTDPYMEVDLIEYFPAVVTGFAPLVINLLSFDAYRYEDRSAKLSWTAIVDEESDYFDIERSTDGISWTLASSQPILIKNKDINNFYYTDKEVYSPEGDVKLFYYRLRMVNTDGSYSYSPIREVRFDARSVSREGMAKVFPNPVNQVMNVSLPGNMEDYSTLEMALTKSTGQSVLHEKYEEDLPGSLSYDVSALPAGMYFLRLTFDADEQVIPVIIMH